jgi:hypothetical protein
VRPGDGRLVSVRHPEKRTALTGGAAKFFGACRFSLWLSIEGGSGWDCAACDERKKEARNCQNRQGLIHPVLIGAEEWRQVSKTLRHALKIDDLKFFVCPLSYITPQSWDLLALVNETTDSESGQYLNIGHLPGLAAEIQKAGEGRYREAVRIKRNERHSRWFTERLKEKSKT